MAFDDRVIRLKSASSNMVSARDHPEVISKYLLKEGVQGRVLGPLSPDLAAKVRHQQVWGNPQRAHPQVGVRLIVDLSAPPGHSINNGIE